MPIQALDQLRKKRKLSQAQLSDIFSVTRQQVSRYEQGIDVPTTDTLIGIYLKARETWAREWAWACLNARYPGVFIRGGNIK